MCKYVDDVCRRKTERGNFVSVQTSTSLTAICFTTSLCRLSRHSLRLKLEVIRICAVFVVTRTFATIHDRLEA